MFFPWPRRWNVDVPWSQEVFGQGDLVPGKSKGWSDRNPGESCHKFRQKLPRSVCYGLCWIPGNMTLWDSHFGKPDGLSASKIPSSGDQDWAWFMGWETSKLPNKWRNVQHSDVSRDIFTLGDPTWVPTTWGVCCLALVLTAKFDFYLLPSISIQFHPFPSISQT